MACEPCDHGPTMYESYCWCCNGLCPDCSPNDEEELGECDTCSKPYELASRDGRCGDCGDCNNCCTHELEEE